MSHAEPPYPQEFNGPRYRSDSSQLMKIQSSALQEKVVATV